MTNDFIQTISETEQECGDWEVGRYAWKLDNIKVLDNPIPIKGKQGLWNIELDEDAINDVASKIKAVRSNLSLSLVQKKPRIKTTENLKFDSLSIPCLIKQPKQPEVKGVIQKDLGDHEVAACADRFLVDVDGQSIWKFM